MKNLSGGQGQGCNYEEGDRYTDMRRWMHQAVLYGFLLCFAATSSGTLLHYAGYHAPYGLLSLPKLFGIPGGILLTVGGSALPGSRRAPTVTSLRRTTGAARWPSCCC